MMSETLTNLSQSILTTNRDSWKSFLLKVRELFFTMPLVTDFYVSEMRIISDIQN